ncbi:aldo/keto reductase [Phytoactinopolyspora mesophila]|uniref:Aldo/keto reductase n=1 Tax=Phytoactinopolyspora mesophila TaxID=2650750 RepID=A0A7K3MAK5_9ACTN|nr:aldo/keto reductase [Phytoactinopolyspora mesophila]
MKTVELGRTGEQVSQLALGCMLMGTRTDEATSRQMLDRYVGAGGTFLDTADCYCWWHMPAGNGGESEELLGRWMSEGSRRDQVFLATKGSGVVQNPDDARMADGSTDWSRVRFVGAGADTLRAAVDGSLRRLRTDHIDLYYVHVDDHNTPLEETLEALAGIVQSGKVRYIGWSNVRAWRLERIRQLCAQHGWPAPVAVQQQHSYLRPPAGRQYASVVGDEHMDYLQTHDDLTLVAYSPILQGAYEPERRTGHRMLAGYAGPDTDARLAAVDQLAAELDVTPSQVVLAWMLHQTEPERVALMGPRTLDHYDAAMPALDVKLTAEQLTALDAAGT